MSRDISTCVRVGGHGSQDQRVGRIIALTHERCVRVAAGGCEGRGERLIGRARLCSGHALEVLHAKFIEHRLGPTRVREQELVDDSLLERFTQSYAAALREEDRRQGVHLVASIVVVVVVATCHGDGEQRDKRTDKQQPPRYLG